MLNDCKHRIAVRGNYSVVDKARKQSCVTFGEVLLNDPRRINKWKFKLHTVFLFGMSLWTFCNKL